MRRFLAPSLALLVAACASTPAPKPAAAVVEPTARPSGTLIGLTANELFTRFGQPSFQVREGPGMKLQWSANGCVLDTYLYPPGSGRGAETVTHVDTRRPSGLPLSQPECLALMGR